MKKLVILLILLLSLVNTFGNHTKGGYLFYEYLGNGTANPSFNKFRVTLKVYMDINSSLAQIGGNIGLTYFNRDNGSVFLNNSVAIASDNNLTNCILVACHPCFSSIPSVRYKIITYVDEVELPSNGQGYTISYQRCCRINGIVNLQGPTNNIGGTWTIDIPGQNVGNNAYKNSSAIFTQNDTVIVCKNNYFEYDFKANDVDGDVLRYSFCDALDGASQSTPSPTQSSAPPYGSVPYSGGFSGAAPLGGNVSINSSTGLIKGIAPSTPGTYVITVCVEEVRNNIVIARVRKEIHMDVGDCSAVNVDLDFNNVTCDGFTQTFINAAGNPGGLIHSYFWDFGVPGVTNDTSNLENPTFTFPYAGVFIVKLSVNRGEPCRDSAIRPLGVYPGFFPNFTNIGVCYNSPIQFNDASTTAYGVVNSWRWDFGDAAVLNDTSRLQNPNYTYPIPGTKSVQLVVTNSKGCIDTIQKEIVLIDKPTVNLPFKDTLICSIDTLQLFSSISSGNPKWSPNYRISNVNILNPLVNPLVTTTYTITANDQGCIQKDSIRVRVKDFVTVDVMPDTIICLTDAFIIQTNSDALSYSWTPAATLNNPTIQDPIATPVAAVTKYVVRANIGKCQSADSITVIASPYPNVNAGPDVIICYGDSTQLTGTISGTLFNWSPQNGLINGNTLNPIATPIKTTQYVLSTSSLIGCKKPARDTMMVTVIPPVKAFAGRDTSIVVGQSLQLFATGATSYVWTPASFLNNPNINNPIATLNNNQTYTVLVSDTNGCFAVDTINIIVFKTAPDIFVPTAFSPNGDGRNDRLIPIPVGLKGYDFFEIYNRWGQRLFRTTQINVGWDGYFRGVLQDVDTFVWQVQGTDYTGKRIFKKGTCVLVK
jgi:gliding motility-associated-like protein